MESWRGMQNKNKNLMKPLLNYEKYPKDFTCIYLSIPQVSLWDRYYNFISILQNYIRWFSKI